MADRASVYFRLNVPWLALSIGLRKERVPGSCPFRRTIACHLPDCLCL